MKWYLFEYQYQGSSWAFDILALNEQDARARVEALNTAVFNGEVFAKVPAPDSMPIMGDWPELGRVH